jgi:hypothetical protein
VGPTPHSLNKDKSTMKKNAYLILVIILSFAVSGCPNDTDAPNQKQPEIPSSDGKTYLKIENKTQYAVNVYINDPPLYDIPAELLRQVPANGSAQWELHPTQEGQNGETLYFEYLIPIGSTTVPFYPNNIENVKLKKLEAGKVNVQETPALGSAQTNSAFVLIKNNTKDSIWFEERFSGSLSSVKYPFGSSNRDIPGLGDAVFVFGGNTIGSNTASLGNCSIGDNTRRNFPNITLEKGAVYTFIYDGKNDPGLFLTEPFDPGVIKKIWYMPVYVADKYWQMGKQKTRRNPADGIVVLGSLHSEPGADEGSSGYFALVNQYGEVQAERLFKLPNNPVIYFLDVHERENGDFIIAYLAEYEAESKLFLMCYTSGGITKWQVDCGANLPSSFTPGNFYLEYSYIAEKDSKTFGLGGEIWDYRDDGDYTAAIVTEVKENAAGTGAFLSWNSPYISNFISYASDGVVISARRCKGLVYNKRQDYYIAIEFFAKDKNEEGVYTILRASDGAVAGQNAPKEYDKFGFLGISEAGDKYYVYGEYIDVNGKYSAAALRFNSDMANDTSFPAVIVPSDLGDTEFKDCINDNTKVIFAGAINTGGVRKPWTYAIDKNTGNKLWENVYDNSGYNTIWSIGRNSIGTLQMELYSNVTGASLIVNTDLLGRISGEMKAAIPRIGE